MGDILSAMRDVQYRGGYHDTCGDIISTVGGYHLLLFEYLHGTEHPHGTLNILHMHHDIPHGTQITKDDIPHSTEHPTTLMISSTCIMMYPMVLNIPHGTQDIPTVLTLSPTVLNTPHYSRCHHDIPMVLNTPNGIEQTLYEV